MTDTTQGDDMELFQQATTLDDFENAKPAPEKPDEPVTPSRPPEPPPAQPIKPVEPPPAPAAEQTEAAVPSHRLREESEARRKAERERDEALGRLNAYERMQQQAREGQQPKQIDLFDNPSGFVQQEVKPYLEQVHSEMVRMREAMSLDNAMRGFGQEKVFQARQALEQGMARSDPAAWATYQRAMQSHDPYGVITRWHQERETLASIGGDINAYNQRVIEEGMKNPEVQKRFLEFIKGNGAHVAQPATVTPKVSVSPSLSNIGAGSTDNEAVEPSDIELFRAATSAKRHR